MNYFRKDEVVDDAQLSSASQLNVASLIKSLPDEELSISWRSELNVKLMAARQAKKKQKVAKRVFGWGSSLSFGVAATAYMMVMTNATTVVAPNSKLESPSFATELVRTHQESVVLASVSGTSSLDKETSISEDSYNQQDELL